MDELADSILIYLPLFYKKITTPKVSDIEKSNYKRRTLEHYQILGVLEHHNNLAISEIGKRLMISKPKMTSHIDKLVSDGMVERIPNKKDRRVIKISLTTKGYDYIKESRIFVNNNIKNNLAPLNSEELEQLGECIKNIKNKVLLRIENNGSKNRTPNTD